MNRLIQTTLKKTVAPSASSKRFFSSSAKALFPVKRVDAAEAVAVYQEQTGYGKPAVKHDDHGHGHGHDHGHAKEVHHPEPTAVFVDLRSAVDTKNFVFQGFVNVPFSELSTKMSTIPSGKDVYLLDTTGMESEQAAELLTRSGYNSVHVVDGGVLRWVSASGALKPEVPELQAALELPLSMLESADKSDTVLKSASEKRGLRVSDKELKQMLADM
jgi:rhodanese-related sulfurtransferase